MELTGIDIRHSKHWCGSKLATKLNNKFGVVSMLLNFSKMFPNYNKRSALMKCSCLNMSYCVWKLNKNTVVSYLFPKGSFNYKFFTWSSRYWLCQTLLLFSVGSNLNTFSKPILHTHILLKSFQPLKRVAFEESYVAHNLWII